MIELAQDMVLDKVIRKIGIGSILYAKINFAVIVQIGYWSNARSVDQYP